MEGITCDSILKKDDMVLHNIVVEFKIYLIQRFIYFWNYHNVV